LEAIDRIDLLVRYLPEWGAVRCRPQRDPYHRYTVDVHLLRTLGEMSRLLEGAASSEPLSGDRAGGGADPIAAEAAGLVGRDDGLLLGALLHDIGKVGEGAHVDAGARLAAAALSRMGIDAGPRQLALFLVGEHLLLPDTATRRDLADEELILRVAARIGSPERLAALYLLVRADAAATGPQAWTPWRRALVHELVAKVQRVFDHGDVATESAAELAAAVASIRAIAGADDAIVEAFLRRMPSTYLRTVAPDEAVAHLRLLAAPLSATEVRTAAAPGRRHGTYALTVVAVDRPGLLSWVAGALSIAGLSILTATVFTTDDGIAVDLFEVHGQFEVEVGEDRWRQFRSSLRRAIEGRLSLESGVRERRRHYPRRRGGSPVSVTIDGAASDLYTVIEVAAPDRIGLLYDITRTLAELSLDVHLAKVATYGERVIDAFYVREIAGGKLEDPARLTTIRAALASRAES
jgi:[protein-PII] uridylyltransferase